MALRRSPVPPWVSWCCSGSVASSFHRSNPRGSQCFLTELVCWGTASPQACTLGSSNSSSPLLVSTGDTGLWPVRTALCQERPVAPRCIIPQRTLRMRQPELLGLVPHWQPASPHRTCSGVTCLEWAQSLGLLITTLCCVFLMQNYFTTRFSANTDRDQAQYFSRKKNVPWIWKNWRKQKTNANYSL